jgi:tRNA pseudouridine38-40 synthase
LRIALGIEYRGTDFSGWQLQDGARTVQDCVERAVARVADHPLRVVCAGRTDARVHALGQVVHFDTHAVRTPRAWVFGSNTHLPDDVSVLWALPVEPDFHARFSALRRHYRYVIYNASIRPAVFRSCVAWEFRPLDVESMKAAAADLLGEHDFSSFRSYACQAKHPVRTLYRLDVERHGRFVVLDVVANAFLHHMVRNLAGVLMEIGMGKRPIRWAREVLEARDRRLGGFNASPDGLYLVGVQYPERHNIPYDTRSIKESVPFSQLSTMPDTGTGPVKG